MLGLRKMKYLPLIICLCFFGSACNKKRECECTVVTNWNDTTGKDFERILVAKNNIIANTKKNAQHFCDMGDQSSTTRAESTATGKMTTTVSVTWCKIK
jgi:hypothetical protein